jgi:nitroreductase
VFSRPEYYNGPFERIEKFLLILATDAMFRDNQFITNLPSGFERNTEIEIIGGRNMDATEAIQGWRSIRRFKDEPVPEEALEKVLEAGRRTPSWENVQPWHFIVVTDAEMKQKLVALTKGQKFVASAPAVIAVCGDVSAWDKPKNRAALMELIENGVMKATAEVVDNFILKDPVYCVAENGPAVILARTFEQLGIAYGFMGVEAVNQGLGMCIVGAFGNEVTGDLKEVYDDVRAGLALPEKVYLLALLPIGIPAETPAARPRKPLEAIASRGSYGVAFKVK